MRVSRLVWVGTLVLAAVAFVAVACGGDEEAAANPSDPSATNLVATATGTAEEPTAAPEADEKDPPATPVVEEEPTATPVVPRTQLLDIAMVPALTFDKTDLRARAGAQITVRFDNQETGIPHNWAVYTDNSASEAVAGANRNICTAPCDAEVTFGPLEPGTYFFRCDVHPTIMTGELVVEG